MNTLNPIALILKSKGVGPSGSRSLNTEHLELLEKHLPDPKIALATKSTLLTAFLMLENTPEESRWLNRSFEQGLWPFEFRWMWDLELAAPELPVALGLRRALAKEELDVEFAKKACRSLLLGQEPEWQGAAFLEAMRLKRESFAENDAFWDVLKEFAAFECADVEHVLDLSDAYDGLSRSPLLSLCSALLLAELGYPVSLHGTKELAPKFGLNLHDLLRALGLDPLLDLKEAARRLENPALGWAYVDQEVYAPALAALKGLRKDMVKRPFLATFEKMLLPLRGKTVQTLVGYTHTAYRSLLADLLRGRGECSRFAVLRGVEGGARPSLARESLYCVGDGAAYVQGSFDPSTWGLVLREEPVCVLDAEQMAERCRLILAGQDDLGADMVLAQCAFVLEHLYGIMSEPLMERMRELLKSGQLLGRLA